MHRALRLALFVGLSLSLLMAGDVQADWLERKWTNTEGKSITARFIRATPTMALLNQDGKVIRAPLAQLVQSDRDWIAAAEELRKMREWQLQDGTSHRARLQDIEGDMLTLEERSETIQLFVTQLNPDDQSLIAKVSATASAGPLTSPTPSASPAPRTWTDKRGKTIEAEFRGVEGDKVVLLFRNKEHRVPMTDLSEGDQQYVQSQQRPQQEIAKAPGEAPSSRSPEEMAQEERIEELLRKRRERADRLAENPDPPMEERPLEPAPTYEPAYPEPQHASADNSDFGPSSWQGGPRPRLHRGGWDDEQDEASNHYAPQPVYQQVIICQGCRHEHLASSFKAGDKCRGCGQRIDIIQNADGSTHSSSVSYSGRKIGRIITGVAALVGILFGVAKKVLG